MFSLHSHAGRLCLHGDSVGSESVCGETAEQPACPCDRLAPPSFQQGEFRGTGLGMSELHTLDYMLLPCVCVFKTYTQQEHLEAKVICGPLAPSPKRTALEDGL